MSRLAHYSNVPFCFRVILEHRCEVRTPGARSAKRTCDPIDSNFWTFSVSVNLKLNLNHETSYLWLFYAVARIQINA